MVYIPLYSKSLLLEDDEPEEEEIWVFPEEEELPELALEFRYVVSFVRGL